MTGVMFLVNQFQVAPKNVKIFCLTVRKRIVNRPFLLDKGSASQFSNECFLPLGADNFVEGTYWRVRVLSYA